MNSIKNIAVLGAGTWGSTLATLLSKKGFAVKLWEYDKKLANFIDKKRTLRNLPGLKIPPQIEVTSSLREIPPADVIIVAVPSFAFRKTVRGLAKAGCDATTPIVVATKGFEISSSKTLSRVVAEELPRAPVAILTGPSHAEEVSKNIPTAITVASKDEVLMRLLQSMFSTKFLRVYTNPDYRGAEIGGAIKNIYAIAAGISDGLGLGDNTKAALVTRSLNEMSRLGVALGGKFETFLGLSGVGDLIVTCYSRHSRNRRLGEMVGRGMRLKTVLRKMSMVAEGIYAVKAIYKLRKKLKIDLPIVDEVYRILYMNKPPKKSIATLMLRPLKAE